MLLISRHINKVARRELRAEMNPRFGSRDMRAFRSLCYHPFHAMWLHMNRETGFQAPAKSGFRVVPRFRYSPSNSYSHTDTRNPPILVTLCIGRRQWPARFRCTCARSCVRRPLLNKMTNILDPSVRPYLTRGLRYAGLISAGTLSESLVLSCMVVPRKST